MISRGYKRIYLGSASGIITLLYLFLILQSAGLEIIDLSGDIQCSGSLDNPCISYFNVKNISYLYLCFFKI